MSEIEICEHDWQEELVRDRNFGVVFGVIRVCRKCKKRQHNDFTEGRVGGTWKDLDSKGDMKT